VPDSKTASGAFDRIKAHEDLCAERYANIHATLAEMKADAKVQNRLIIGVLLALVGWMGVQLWTGQPHPGVQAVAAALR
jgi:uncharacterized protein YbcC (UPF0753/DUF2309 family)